LFGARLLPLSHIQTAPPFPPEALSRFVQFRLTTNPSLRGVPKQLHRANVGSVARNADPHAPDEFAAPRDTMTKTTDRYQLGVLAHTYAALVSVSELTDRTSPQCLQGCPRSGRWTIVWHSQQLSRTEFILAIRLWPTKQTRVGNARNLGSGPAGRASGPSFARLPTTVTARPRLGDPSIHFQRVEYATAGVGRHPDICQLKNQRTIICAP